MKKIFAALFITASFAFASAQTISFNETTIDYGTVKNGADGHRFFTVKNTGDKPLIISKVQPSCGCTTPKFSSDPIMPGKTAQIEVGYNTSIVGQFTKIIEVYSNDPENSRSVINIKGIVQPAEAVAVAMDTNANAPQLVRAEKEVVAEKKSIEQKEVQLKATRRAAKSVDK
jgi:hypothetical protein